jgi:uncharacterized phage protein gp47/JayE
MAKSFDQIINDVVAGITSAIGPVDARVGSVLRDAILAPLSNEISKLYSENESVSLNQGVASIDLDNNTAVERLASNYGISRSLGIRASGDVRFYVQNLTGTDSITVPVFTTVSTPAPESITYKTSATKVITTANYDSNLKAFFVDIPVICDYYGTKGNVLAGTIIVETLGNVDGVINLNDFTNGVDEQTNEEIVSIVQSTARGNVGTEFGYDSIIRNNFNVSDVVVITPSSPDTIGGQNLGITDIIVQTGTTAIAEESLIFVSESVTTEYTPLSKPFISVYQITGIKTVDGSETVVPLEYGATGDYEFIRDTSSVYAYSYQDLSKIYFHIRPSLELDRNSYLTIKYYYAMDVNSVQAFLSTPEQNAIGSNVLVKSAIPVEVGVSAGINIVYGYDLNAVVPSVIAALQEYLNLKTIGDSVQSSDLIATIAGVEGVESVNVATFKMYISTEPLVNVSNVATSNRQYIKYYNATINVES